MATEENVGTMSIMKENFSFNFLPSLKEKSEISFSE